MLSKERYCYRILKTYSLIVDFDGTPSRENVPAPKDGETLMTVLVTNENENGYTGEYKEIEYLDAHFRVKHINNGKSGFWAMP